MTVVFWEFKKLSIAFLALFYSPYILKMKKILIFVCLIGASLYNHAQTDLDGIMMEKNNFCAGLVYQQSSWDNYWEGTLKRTNENIGTVTTTAYAFMGNYGISNKLNLVVALPYITTKASAGTLQGQSGLQDVSFAVKYMPLEKEIGKLSYSLYTVVGATVPTSNYVADFLPLSIGLHSETAFFRLINDIQIGRFYTTFSGTYVKRGNVNIDRNAYFTTEYHYTNEVFMPNVITSNVRLGYRYGSLIADVYYDTFVTQKGGFDITRNNMPFPSNTMNSAKWGIYAKYNIEKVDGLSVIASYDAVTSGRNVGQSKTFMGGLFYIINFKKETKNEIEDSRIQK
jgi:hypothetical protein